MNSKVVFAQRKKWYKNLTIQVLLAIILGVMVGILYPSKDIHGACMLVDETGKCLPGLAEKMKPLADIFIKMVKMVIGPIVFLTLVAGIAHIGDIKKVGRMGGKAIIYFEIVTTIALIMGMIAMNLFHPGAGFDTSQVSHDDISKFTAAAKSETTIDFLMNIVPDSMVGAFAKSDMLQILFVSVLFGVALSAMGESGKMIEEFCEKVSHVLFRIIGMIMKLAPLGTFGAMAFAIGKYGVTALLPMLNLVLLACATMAVFVAVVLGAVARYYKIELWKFIRYIKDEIFIVLGTGSSESVLPQIMEKMQKLGCSKPVVGLVLPTGYSFNLAGSSLYLTMCVLFVAEAYKIPMTLGQQLSVLGIMLFTSKGAAGVVGSAFIILAATVQATGFLPVEGIAILLGIDRFMSSIRAMINLIGNGLATLVIAKTENEFDPTMMQDEYYRVLGEK